MSDVPLQHIPCKQLLSGVLSERQINQLTFEKWKILSNNSYTLMIFDKALSNTFIHLISRSVSQSVSQSTNVFFNYISVPGIGLTVGNKATYKTRTIPGPLGLKSTESHRHWGKKHIV